MQAVKEEICSIGHKLWEKGWVAANDGNISIRIGDDRFLATPTGVSKLFLKPEMILEVNSKGEVLDGNKKYKASSEFPMHSRCYKDRKDVNSVLHAHPPYATAFAVADIPLDSYTLPEAIISLGAVPVARYGTPGSQEVPEEIAKWLGHHDVILMQNHGALAVGKDLINAYYRMETLELFAQTSFIAKLLGGEKELTKKQIDDCLALRVKYGMNGPHPGYIKLKK
jgi:L-fuculose-phosphate aldolase